MIFNLLVFMLIALGGLLVSFVVLRFWIIYFMWVDCVVYYCCVVPVVYLVFLFAAFRCVCLILLI